MSILKTERRQFIDPEIPTDQYTEEQQKAFKDYILKKKKQKKLIKIPKTIIVSKFTIPFFFDTDQAFLVEKTFNFDFKDHIRNVNRIVLTEYMVRGFRFDDFLNDHYFLADFGGFTSRAISNAIPQARYDFLNTRHVFFVAKDENINDTTVITSDTLHKYYNKYPNGRQVNLTFIELLKKITMRFYRRNGSDMFTLHYKNINPLDSYARGTEPTFVFISDFGDGSNNTDIRFADNSQASGTTTVTASITADTYNTSSTLCTVIADKMTLARLIRASSSATPPNKNIDFSDGSGVHLATLTSDEYAYPFSTLMTNVGSKMTTAGSQTYTVTYNDTTGFVTISAPSAFSLLWSSGANAATNSAVLLGFAATDLSGSTSYTGTTSLRYQCTYDLTTQKFTILNQATPSFILYTSVAAFTAENMLGFSNATNKTGANTYTSDTTAPQPDDPVEDTTNQMPFFRLLLWGYFEIDFEQEKNI